MNSSIVLTDPVQRAFFEEFHGAHIELYRADEPADKSLRGRTAPGGLYISDGFKAQGRSLLDHEVPQAQFPRILLAVSDCDLANGDAGTLHYDPLLPMPSATLESVLHPLNTCLHSARVPAFLRADNFVWLLSRYSQSYAAELSLRCL